MRNEAEQGWDLDVPGCLECKQSMIIPLTIKIIKPLLVLSEFKGTLNLSLAKNCGLVYKKNKAIPIFNKKKF